MAEITGRGARV
uniref:Uncharacterized protein n=1 Tax=Arundo donax TaxID=35708 RepID=A0A0A9BIH3_ARUDO